MGTDSLISWTDHTKNFWIGCLEVSPACNSCYARILMTRKPRWANTWGPHQTTERIPTKHPWRDVNKWNRLGLETGRKQFVFTQSLSDMFEDNPDLTSLRNEVLSA